MLLNKFRNKKIIKKFTDVTPSKNHEGDLIEIELVKGKDENMYVVIHKQFSNEDGSLSTRGKYVIQNNNYKKIGYLKYTFFENNDPPYMKLNDIFIGEKSRNNGLGSLVLNMFEKRAKAYGALYIDGSFSSVDEGFLEDKELRNNFYIKRGYEIIDSNKIHKAL